LLSFWYWKSQFPMLCPKNVNSMIDCGPMIILVGFCCDLTQWSMCTDYWTFFRWDLTSSWTDSVFSVVLTDMLCSVVLPPLHWACGITQLYSPFEKAAQLYARKWKVVAKLFSITSCKCCLNRLRFSYFIMKRAQFQFFFSDILSLLIA